MKATHEKRGIGSAFYFFALGNILLAITVAAMVGLAESATDDPGLQRTLQTLAVLWAMVGIAWLVVIPVFKRLHVRTWQIVGLSVAAWLLNVALVIPVLTIYFHAPPALQAEISLARWLSLMTLAIIPMLWLVWRPRYVPRVLLSGISLGFTVLLLEILVRVYIASNPIYYQPVFAPDEAIGWRLIENTTFEWAGQDPLCVSFRNNVRANGQGFYDLDHSIAKPDGVQRIAFLGDSFVMAREVPIDQRFSSLLVNSETLNFGMTGFSIGQYIPTYTTYAAPYAPDVVIALVSEIQMIRTANREASLQAGGITDNAGYELRPYYNLDESGVLVYTPPQGIDAYQQALATQLDANGNPIRQTITRPSEQYPNATLFNSPYAWLITQSRLAYLLHTRLGTARRNLYDSFTSLPDTPVYAIEELKFPLQTAVLIELKRRVTADGATLILLDLSANPDVRDWLQHFTEQQSIGYIDITTPISQAQQNGTTIALPCDGHFTPAAHQVVAQTIQQALDSLPSGQ